MRPLEDHPVMSRLAADSVKNVDLPFNRNTLAQVLTGKQSELRRELASSGVSRIAVDVLLLHDLKDFRVPEHLCREDARVFGAAAAEVLDTNDKPAVVFLSFVALDK